MHKKNADVEMVEMACDMDAENSEIYSTSEHKKFLMGQLFEDRNETGDTELIVCEEGDNGNESTIIKCHKNILESRSEYFKGFFEF